MSSPGPPDWPMSPPTSSLRDHPDRNPLPGAGAPVLIDPAFGKGGRPEGRWACPSAPRSLTIVPPPRPLLLPVASPPHLETLLSRLQAPTLPTSSPFLSSSVCPFPHRVKRRVNTSCRCLQLCRWMQLCRCPARPGCSLAGHRVVSRGTGLGVAQQGAALTPVPHTPRPASGVTQDPPWASPTLGRCPPSCADRRGFPPNAPKRFTPTPFPQSAPCPVGMLHPHQVSTAWQGQTSGPLYALLCILLCTQV